MPSSFFFPPITMGKDLLAANTKPSTSAVDFIPAFFLGTSSCHLISSLQNLWFLSFYSLILFSYNMAQNSPWLKQTGTHWTKQNRSFSVFNLLIQYLWGYHPSNHLVSPQNFWKELSSFPSFVYSLYSKEACQMSKQIL